MKARASLRAAPVPAWLAAGGRLRFLFALLGWFLAGMAATALVYQIPARHTVQIGLDDESYVQGFADPANRWGLVTDTTGVSRPYRWSGPEASLIFPQLGLPARATIRWRAWRPKGVPLPRVRVLLNGREELGSYAATGDWEEHSFTIRGGLAKPRDVFLQLVVEPSWKDGDALRGVEVDRAVLETSAWPILPYPAQLLGGGLAALLAALALRRPRLRVAVVAGMALLFLLLYRLALTPYPLRLFWPIAIGLLACLAVARQVDWAAPAATWSWLSTAARARLLDGVALAVVAVTSAALWWASRAHVVLSLPGVEKDFRVFATRSDRLFCPPSVSWSAAGCVLRADGFYQLGYPFVLWLARLVSADNPFLAARLVGIASTALFLAGAYLLGRAVLGRAGGLLALVGVALNRWTAEYALYAGTDMAFAAAWTLALAALLTMRGSRRRAFGAGLLCGLAFVVRHPGIVLLPLGLGLLVWEGYSRRATSRARYRWDLGALLLGGFVLASLPQFAVNLADTGNPLYSQQAKNIWLAVYGNTDWSRWGEASDDVALVDVVAQAPARFVSNWWGNLRAFWGTGSEDTSEFGRGLALRLLGFPANLLAVGGLVLWLCRGAARERFLLVVALLYVAALAVGFLLPRFVVPLVSSWSVAAAAAALFVWSRAAAASARARQALAGGGLVLLLLLAGSPRAGVRSVVNNQDPDAAAAVALIRSTLKPGERLAARLPAGDSLAKYSAIAHLVAPENDPSVHYLLRTGPAPAGKALAGRVGKYALYKLQP